MAICVQLQRVISRELCILVRFRCLGRLCCTLGCFECLGRQLCILVCFRCLGRLPCILVCFGCLGREPCILVCFGRLGLVYPGPVPFFRPPPAPAWDKPLGAAERPTILHTHKTGINPFRTRGIKLGRDKLRDKPCDCSFDSGINLHRAQGFVFKFIDLLLFFTNKKRNKKKKTQKKSMLARGFTFHVIH